MIIHTNNETLSTRVKLRGFWNEKEARKRSPVVSRPDLVAERNGRHPSRGLLADSQDAREFYAAEHVMLKGNKVASEPANVESVELETGDLVPGDHRERGPDCCVTGDICDGSHA